MSQVRLGASKTYSVADGVSIKSRREKDDWGQFDFQIVLCFMKVLKRKELK